MSDQCDNCGYPAKVLKTYMTGVPEQGYTFCEVCSNTFLSRATSYPRQYGEQGPLFQSLGYIANMILDAIKETKQQ